MSSAWKNTNSQMAHARLDSAYQVVLRGHTLRKKSGQLPAPFLFYLHGEHLSIV